MNLKVWKGLKIDLNPLFNFVNHKVTTEVIMATIEIKTGSEAHNSISNNKFFIFAD